MWAVLGKLCVITRSVGDAEARKQLSPLNVSSELDHLVPQNFNIDDASYPASASLVSETAEEHVAVQMYVAHQFILALPLFPFPIDFRYSSCHFINLPFVIKVDELRGSCKSHGPCLRKDS